MSSYITIHCHTSNHNTCPGYGWTLTNHTPPSETQTWCHCHCPCGCNDDDTDTPRVS